LIRLLQKIESEKIMVRLQDDFYDYVNGKWAETAVIPDDKPSTGGFMDLIQEIENLMLDITGKWQRGEELPEDSILQNFVKYHKMVADFDAREAAGVAPAMPLINEIKALSSFEDYTSKLGTYELAGKPNLMPFSVSPDFMNAQMNVSQSYWLFGVKWLKNSWQNSISQRQKSRISWIRSLRPMQNWPNMSCQTKKNPSITNSTILMNGQISRPWFQNCHLIPSLQK